MDWCRRCGIVKWGNFRNVCWRGRYFGLFCFYFLLLELVYLVVLLVLNVRWYWCDCRCGIWYVVCWCVWRCLYCCVNVLFVLLRDVCGWSVFLDGLCCLVVCIWGCCNFWVGCWWSIGWNGFWENFGWFGWFNLICYCLYMGRFFLVVVWCCSFWCGVGRMYCWWLVWW